MKILNLELCGYKRLLLNNIKYFKLTPEEMLQLILGTNGSGKSSILKELSPLPALPAEFTKDGYKIIDINHNNNLYNLKNIFSPSGNKFIFTKNGEELSNGTVSVFRELVKREFNITSEVHDLMTGVTAFHQFSVAERRNWFTKISDSDYTYAIQYYQRLREQLRDIQGAVKLNQSRLVQESEKLLSPEEEAQCREEIADLNKLTSMLLEMKMPTSHSRDAIRSQLNSYESQLNEMSRQLVGYRKKFLNYERFSSVEEIELEIINNQALVNSFSIRSEELCKRIEKEQQTAEALQKTNLESFGDLDKNIDNLVLDVGMLNKQLRYNLTFIDPNRALQALSTVYGNLATIFTNLEPNSNIAFSRENYAKLRESHRLANEETKQLDVKQHQYLARKKELEHLKEHGQIECPNCSHKWYQGYSEHSYRKLEALIEQNGKRLEQLQEQQGREVALLEKFDEQLGLQRAYIDISRNWPLLQPVWAYINDEYLDHEKPHQILTLLEAIQEDLKLAIQIQELNQKLKEAFDLKELLSKNQETDLVKVREQLAELEQDLVDANTTVRNTKAYIARLNMYREVCQKVAGLEKQIEAILTDRQTKAEELIDTLRREALNETINVVQLELNKKEQVISKINIQKALVATLENQIAELSERAEVLKLAVRELSPSEGLIAKGLTGFINHFVTQINKFIKKIWLYPMELIPIEITEDESLELDYKFAVRINDSVVIQDISKGSSAMREVIDLAFKVVSMPYLGLQEAPLYLDEFGARLDFAHRHSAFHAIHNLITTSNFSQIFMISHYESSYGSLKNADITVLCQENMPVMKDCVFNKVAIIK